MGKQTNNAFHPYETKLRLATDGSNALEIYQDTDNITVDDVVTMHQQYMQKKAAEKAQIRRERFIRRAIICLCSAALLFLCVQLLNATSENQQLTRAINSLENEYETLKSHNDSKEIDLQTSTSYSDVVQIATQELGMIRADNKHVIKYQPSDKEYIRINNVNYYFNQE